MSALLSDERYFAAVTKFLENIEYYSYINNMRDVAGKVKQCYKITQLFIDMKEFFIKIFRYTDGNKDYLKLKN